MNDLDPQQTSAMTLELTLNLELECVDVDRGGPNEDGEGPAKSSVDDPVQRRNSDLEQHEDGKGPK